MRRLLGLGLVLTVIFVAVVNAAPAVAPSLGSVAPAVKVMVNGKEVITDVAPVIVNGRAMVPIRFVAEALGAQVSWSEADRTVLIEATPVQSIGAAFSRLWARITEGASSLVTAIRHKIDG